MDAYFTVNDLEDPFTRLEHITRRARFEAWSKYLAKPDEDLAMVARKFAAASGMSETMAVNTLMALGRLLSKELPLLRKLQEELYHLDFTRLIAIDRALNKADMKDEPTAAYLDAAITAFLTPKRPRQELPSARAIQQHIDEIITRVDETVASDKEMESSARSRYELTVENASEMSVSATLDPATAIIVDEHIHKAAQRYGLTKVQAFVKLLTGEVKPAARVIVNTYAAPSLEGFGFVPGAGWVKTEDLGEVVDTRDMNNAASRVTESYVTPVDIAKFVEGRDGTCRWPGCSKPAQESQKDHRINHEDGGPTAAWNLVSLCQHHHNVKTDQRAFYIMDPLTGVIYWLFGDGTWVVDEPVGPLAEGKAHWLVTLGQAAENRVAAKRQLAQEVKATRLAAEEAESSFDDPAPAEEVVRV